MVPLALGGQVWALSSRSHLRLLCPLPSGVTCNCAFVRVCPGHAAARSSLAVRAGPVTVAKGVSGQQAMERVSMRPLTAQSCCSLLTVGHLASHCGFSGTVVLTLVIPWVPSGL